jgi:hypothetical protein
MQLICVRNETECILAVFLILYVQDSRQKYKEVLKLILIFGNLKIYSFLNFICSSV